MNNLHLVLRQIHIALIKSKRNRKIVQKHSVYLHHGKYKNSITFDCIYNNEYTPVFNTKTFSSHIDGLLLISQVLIRLHNALFTYKVRNAKNPKAFDATEMIISSGLSEIKLFDFQRKQVLTTFKSQTKLSGIIKAKEIFSQTYNIPKTLKVDYNQSYMIEELIPHAEYDLDSVFKQLCEGFCKHLNHYSSTISTNNELYKEACSYYESRLGKCELIDEDIGGIMVYTHGDLWSSNLIVNDEKVYVTDFEHVGVRFFLYDFYMFMFTEWQLNKDDRLIVNYFNGEYDKYLIHLFGLVGMGFYEKRRANYFMVFIVTILFDRWRDYVEIEETIKSFINNFILSDPFSI